MWMPFISLSYLITSDKTSNEKLNRSGDITHPSFVPWSKEKTLNLFLIFLLLYIMSLFFLYASTFPLSLIFKQFDYEIRCSFCHLSGVWNWFWFSFLGICALVFTKFESFSAIIFQFFWFPLTSPLGTSIIGILDHSILSYNSLMPVNIFSSFISVFHFG